MYPTLKRFRLVLVTGLVMLSLLAFAGGVSANACHMLISFGVGANGGMTRAMTVNMKNNSNGNEGMFGAIDRSTAESGCG